MKNKQDKAYYHQRQEEQMMGLDRRKPQRSWKEHRKTRYK